MSSNITIQRICQHCGTEFTARTTVTKYCGDTCAKRAYKARKKVEKVEISNEETRKIKIQPIEIIKAKPYLSISETTRILGISRRTVYRMMERGELNYGKAGSRTIIQRSDIDKIFDQPHPLSKQPDDATLNINDCYHINEVQDKYGISPKGLERLIKRTGIPKTKQGKYTYVPKAAIDKLFN